MKYRKYLGDNRLKPYTVQDKRHTNICIYCGKLAETKEHTPSKVFLKTPYPDNLFITPSCSACNNSFSFSELSVSMFLEVYYAIHFGIDLTEECYERINKFPKLFDQAYIGAKNNPQTYLDEDIKKVIIKLAIGHAVFELSSQYYGDRVDENIEVKYNFLPFMSKEELDEYNSIEQIEILPEIGSRIYGDFDHPNEDDMLGLFVMAIKMVPVGGDPDKDAIDVPFTFIDWVEVQECNYRYICFPRKTDTIVKIVIKEFLHATVVFH